MQRLIVVLLFLVISVWFGLDIVNHPGYLLLVYQPWMVQMPLWFALLGLFMMFGLFFIVIDSIDRLHFLWYRIKNWFRFRREHRFYSKTQHGLAALIEGRWKKAERLLQAGADKTGEPLINYLAAARAAQEQGAYDRRDLYIHKAYHFIPHAELAIGLVQAELEFRQGQLEHAAATLNHLRQASSRHPRVLQLLEKVYVRLADWNHLQALLPSIRKAKTIKAEDMELFEKNIYCQVLRTANNKSLDDLQRIWNDMPRYIRKNADVVCAYVKQLRRFSATKEMEELIRKTLKHHWQPELAKIYGTLPTTNVRRQLVIVGAWLNKYGQHPELLLILGKLCVREQLWGKAKDYFDKCLALCPNAEASLEYGKLLEYLDLPDEARQKYRDGLMLLAAASQK